MKMRAGFTLTAIGLLLWFMAHFYPERHVLASAPTTLQHSPHRSICSGLAVPR